MSQLELAAPIIGPYLCQDLLGEGGLCNVYLATDLTRPRSVALKVVADAYVRDPIARQHIANELAALRRLEGAPVAQLVSSGESCSGAPYLALELLAGPTLSAWRQARPTSPIEDTLRLFARTLASLARVHMRGVLHGDMKSSNVLVLGRGRSRPLLIDFGLARRAPAGGWLVGEARGSEPRRGACGTPEYMAPELFLGANPSLASEVYAAGIVLYELLAGRPPFMGQTPTEVALRQIDDDPPPPSARSLMPVPPQVDRLVLQALEKRPERRFADPRHFRHALMNVLTELRAAKKLRRVRAGAPENLSSPIPT
jgi:eukaryotic-like serine/threonine-protein kinase